MRKMIVRSVIKLINNGIKGVEKARRANRPRMILIISLIILNLLNKYSHVKRTSLRNFYKIKFFPRVIFSLLIILIK